MATYTEVADRKESVVDISDDLQDFIKRVAAEVDENPTKTFTSPQIPLPKIQIGEPVYVKAVKYWKRKVYKSKIVQTHSIIQLVKFKFDSSQRFLTASVFEIFTRFRRYLINFIGALCTGFFCVCLSFLYVCLVVVPKHSSCDLFGRFPLRNDWIKANTFCLWKNKLV